MSPTFEATADFSTLPLIVWVMFTLLQTSGIANSKLPVADFHFAVDSLACRLHLCKQELRIQNWGARKFPSIPNPRCPIPTLAFLLLTPFATEAVVAPLDLREFIRQNKTV
ncbi:MAG: hypothetical protein KME38_25165 [Spirirestis rafaelensis WJT71-NPBG6]|nr:hypothetical protein [Spirirestis rafaelensis WJT71-NPBG6]